MPHRFWTVIVRRHGLLLALVALAVLFLYGSLLQRTVGLTHERLDMYLRVQQYMQEMRNRFPQPQLFPDAIRGAGYAFPAFYPPAGYYVAAILGLIAHDPILGTNLSLFLSALVSALTCYACMAAISKRQILAFVGAMIYMTATYRFVDVFVRGALAECWSFAWYPLAILGAFRLMENRRGGWLLSVALAGALVTHTVMAMYFVLALGLALLVALAVTGRPGSIPRLVVHGLLGLALAAWHIVPQQYYLKGIWLTEQQLMLSTAEGVSRHGAYFWQLFAADPSNWWGLSTRSDDDGMSYQLGLGHLLAAALALLALCRPRELQRWNSRSRMGLLAGAVAAWFCLTLFLLHPGPFLAAAPRAFSYIQFPWRVESILSLLAAILFCICARVLPARQSVQASVLILGLLLVATVPGFKRARRLDFSVSAESVNRELAHSRGGEGFTFLGEYFPRGYPLAQKNGFFMSDIATTNAQALNWRQTGYGEFRLETDCGPDAKAAVPLLAYPFWRAVTAGGDTVKLGQAHGYLLARLPMGHNTVIFRRVYPAPYWWGWALSLTGLVALTGVAVMDARRLRR